MKSDFSLEVRLDISLAGRIKSSSYFPLLTIVIKLKCQYILPGAANENEVESTQHSSQRESEKSWRLFNIILVLTFFVCWTPLYVVVMYAEWLGYYWDISKMVSCRSYALHYDV